MSSVINYNGIKFTDYCAVPTDLGTSEESGKDWSDLEREAEEADKHQSDFEDEYTKQTITKGTYRDKYNDRKRYVSYLDVQVVRMQNFNYVCSLSRGYVQYLSG